MSDDDTERREREAMAGLDRSQQQLLKRARAMGIKISTETLNKILDQASRSMSPPELAHLYAGSIGGLSGAALHFIPAEAVADILDATAMAIRQHPDKLRGPIQ